MDKISYIPYWCPLFLVLFSLFSALTAKGPITRTFAFARVNRNATRMIERRNMSGFLRSCAIIWIRSIATECHVGGVELLVRARARAAWRTLGDVRSSRWWICCSSTLTTIQAKYDVPPAPEFPNLAKSRSIISNVYFCFCFCFCLWA